MEPEGLRRCLKDLKSKKVKIGTLATDQHLMVGKLMKTDFPKVQLYYHHYKRTNNSMLQCFQIEHQIDVWHSSKNVTKKLTAKAKSKGCEALLKWIRAISNHLWYSSATCKKNLQLLK